MMMHQSDYKFSLLSLYSSDLYHRMCSDQLLPSLINHRLATYEVQAIRFRHSSQVVNNSMGQLGSEDGGDSVYVYSIATQHHRLVEGIEVR